ncbi:MAG: hypothetical protein HY611_10455 [Elusimicrobia bacterium]|nr:hypothetical protein [Elusimicrobiota bacterium]
MTVFGGANVGGFRSGGEPNPPIEAFDPLPMTFQPQHWSPAPAAWIVVSRPWTRPTLKYEYFTVLFGAVGSRLAEWKNVPIYPNGVSPDDLLLDRFLAAAQNNELIFLVGAPLPSAWIKRMRRQGGKIIRWAPREESPTLSMMTQLVAEASVPINPRNIRVIDALPRARSFLKSQWELFQMGLGLDRSGTWMKIRNHLDLRYSVFGAELVDSSPAEFVSALADAGGKDLLLLFAHNKDRRIYFPGGGSVSFDEIDRIVPKGEPRRTIILVTCAAARGQRLAPSLAEILLRRKLARSVFAPFDAIPAEDVTPALDALFQSGNSLREILEEKDFIQFVRRRKAVGRSG